MEILNLSLSKSTEKLFESACRQNLCMGLPVAAFLCSFPLFTKVTAADRL